MSKQTIVLKTNGNPVDGTEATIFNNTYRENTISTSRSGFRIGVFKCAKNKEGFARIELDKRVFEVYQDNKKYIFTVGTTVEVEELS